MTNLGNVQLISFNNNLKHIVDNLTTVVCGINNEHHQNSYWHALMSYYVNKSFCLTVPTSFHRHTVRPGMEGPVAPLGSLCSPCEPMGNPAMSPPKSPSSAAAPLGRFGAVEVLGGRGGGDPGPGDGSGHQVHCPLTQRFGPWLEWPVPTVW